MNQQKPSNSNLQININGDGSQTNKTQMSDKRISGLNNRSNGGGGFGSQ